MTTQAKLFNNLRINYYKDKIPALEPLVQIVEASGKSGTREYKEFVGSILFAYKNQLVTWATCVHIINALPANVNSVDALCEVHKRMYGCDKHSSLIESLETSRIKERDVNRFLWQLSVVLLKSVKAPTTETGSIERLMLQTEGWYND